MHPKNKKKTKFFLFFFAGLNLHFHYENDDIFRHELFTTEWIVRKSLFRTQTGEIYYRFYTIQKIMMLHDALLETQKIWSQ